MNLENKIVFQPDLHFLIIRHYPSQSHLATSNLHLLSQVPWSIEIISIRLNFNQFIIFYVVHVKPSSWTFFHSFDRWILNKSSLDWWILNKSSLDRLMLNKNINYRIKHKIWAWCELSKESVTIWCNNSTIFDPQLFSK